MARKKRHFTRQEIIDKCNQVARERRMVAESPWTAMNIICGYTLYKNRGFRAKRILTVSRAVDEYEKKYWDGEIDLDDMRKKLKKEYGGVEIMFEPYTQEDVRFKKGSFAHWLDGKQIDPMNTIMEYSTRHMIFFFTVMAEKYGYREKRLDAIYKELSKHLHEYEDNQVSIKQWQSELMDYGGIVFEMPKDPLTRTEGSNLMRC